MGHQAHLQLRQEGRILQGRAGLPLAGAAAAPLTQTPGRVAGVQPGVHRELPAPAAAAHRVAVIRGVRGERIGAQRPGLRSVRVLHLLRHLRVHRGPAAVDLPAEQTQGTRARSHRRPSRRLHARVPDPRAVQVLAASQLFRRAVRVGVVLPVRGSRQLGRTVGAVRYGMERGVGTRAGYRRGAAHRTVPG